MTFIIIVSISIIIKFIFNIILSLLRRRILLSIKVLNVFNKNNELLKLLKLLSDFIKKMRFLDQFKKNYSSNSKIDKNFKNLNNILSIKDELKKRYI